MDQAESLTCILSKYLVQPSVPVLPTRAVLVTKNDALRESLQPAADMEFRTPAMAITAWAHNGWSTISRKT